MKVLFMRLIVNLTAGRRSLCDPTPGSLSIALISSVKSSVRRVGDIQGHLLVLLILLNQLRLQMYKLGTQGLRN